MEASPGFAGRRSIRLQVNGREVERVVEPRLLLLDFLREDLGLTGTHASCEQGSCGACAVLLDGAAVHACTLLAIQADGAEITTIEGLAQGGELHPLQQAFSKEHALQCGFCTPGFVIAACDLLARSPGVEEEGIRHALRGNVCRCTGYASIVRAVREVAKGK